MVFKQLFYLCVLSVSLLFVSCDNKQSFLVKGTITEAEGKVVYFEHIGLSSATVIDSVKLKKNGKFSFKQTRPEAPDFYRLKLGDMAINLAIDSTEEVSITAKPETFATEYSIEGSDNCTKIKELTLLQLATNEAYNKLQKEKQQLSPEEYGQRLNELVEAHKEKARNYIFSAPGTSVAYFALFQQINNMLIFDPYDKTDNKLYATVATSWDMLYGESQRAKHLHKLTLQALSVLRGQKSNPFENIEVKTSLSYFEIALPDLRGNTVKLSEVVEKGQVVLIDFTAYQARFSVAHNMNLAGIYEKYRAKGLEIFQVSLDSDLHFWQNVASNIPWISVRDPESIYSKIAATYQARNLPVSFILNRSGEIVKRIEAGENIETELLKVL